jgi:Sortilin, neurotensin receptor 3,
MAKTLRALILAVLLVVTAGVAVAGGTATGGDRWIGEDSEEEEEAEAAGPGPAGADDWFATQRTYPFGSLDIRALTARAAAQASALPAAPGIQAAWQPLGPSNIGGRITDLVASPTQANTVFAGAATGGVWKSTDGGVTFNSVWSPSLTPSIGALAISGTGILYAGTGESNPGGGSVTFPGGGVFRSSDAGATWQSLGLTGTDRIGRIAIDPANSSRIFVAATGNLFVQGGQRGLYRTVDGGVTWQLVLSGANPTTGAVDVAISPTNPNRIYAAMWDNHRQPNGRVYGGPGSGIYRSLDGGATWTRLAGGLPAASTNLGRMGVAVARSDANRLYAIASDTSGDPIAFWTSNNGGDTWTQINNATVSGSQSTFGWWFGRIWVDPANSRHVFVAGVQLVESLDAGSTWRRSSSFHADQHAMSWDPLSASRVYLGNDGGVYRSLSNGSLTGTWTKSVSQRHLQFYTVAVSKQDISRISGGLQDNGSVRSWGSSAWNSILGGDGLQNLIDPTNQNKVYACSQNGSCSRSTDGANTMTPFGTTTSTRRNWLTPVVFDPGNPSIMYYGGNRLNRSTNSAATWTAISPDLSHNSGGLDGFPFGTITCIAVSPSSPSTIYAGTDDARLWITRNTGASWTEITAGLPTRWMTHITIDPTDPNLAYVSVSGFRNGDPTAHVFRTTTAGSSWTDISTNLPDAPVNDLVLDPRNRNLLYAATDVGVFSTTDIGTTWTPVGTALPLVPIADLEATNTGTTTTLTAATFGLGMYRLS